jgi:3-dehydroquinate dehydratase II
VPRVRIEVLNGVNLDLLGRRDPDVYGTATLQDLETRIYEWARELEMQVRCRQTNHEGEYVGFCHDALENADGLVVNPASWTHYSWAIRDALEPFSRPIVEVHISDVDKREKWRRFSVLEGLTAARVVGQGIEGYRHALELLARERP